jgi:superfamily II DNA or RNA helicase
MDDFKMDARKWRFLSEPEVYIQSGTGGLEVEPLKRQFKTAKNILQRFADGHGVLLADDAGLGKTTVGALVAWVVACQNKRVRIYAPNKILQRRWAEELERHLPMLNEIGAKYDRIKPGDIGKLNAGRIQVTTHHALATSHGNSEQRTACDLMIIDEAHRAKGNGSAFNKALHNLGDRAKRKLILTATPFSIQIAELQQLLQFVGASGLKSVGQYASDLKRLYALGDGHDVAAEVQRLECAAKAAIDEIDKYVIRHGIDNLSAAERKYFGDVSSPWGLETPRASSEEIKLLLRMDRLLHLVPAQKGKRRNDPRFHIGWQHVGAELAKVEEQNTTTSPVLRRHIEAASKSLGKRRATPHPKIAAVSKAIRPLVDAGEKVLVFCHHRATASELLSELENSLKASELHDGPPEKVWRDAWKSLLMAGNIWPDQTPPASHDTLIKPVIDWLCTKGLRRQITGWLRQPAISSKALADRLELTKPRNATAERVPTIAGAARALVKVLLDEQSTSTRAVLRNIANGKTGFGGKGSHFPGRLDEGMRVMGSWDHDGHGERPKTHYASQADIVIALFNSPFGPDVLVATDRLSEGVDLHRFCRCLIHYELDPSPVRTLQRNGRVRRIGSWAALTKQPILYAYPTFGGTRDEKAVAIMRRRIDAFGLLLGGVPTLDDEQSDKCENFANEVLKNARKNLVLLNKKLSA